MTRPAKSDVNARKAMDRLLSSTDAFGPIVGILGTTYEFDATFFELDFLPACFGLGGWDDRSWASRLALEKALASTEAAVLLMDARRYRGRPRSLHVEMVPAVGRDGKLLHAKVLLLVHERAVRLFVGSANLTEAGYRCNREVVLPLAVTPEHGMATGLIREGLTDMRHILKDWWTPSAERVRALALERLAQWHPGARSTDERFVWSGHGEALAERVLREWPAGEPIHRLSIVSPFWSEEVKGGGPLHRLLERLSVLGAFPVPARLDLYAEAAVGGTQDCTPLMPASVFSVPVEKFSVTGAAHAVDPMALAEEVGGRTDFVQRRPLHAKVLLMEGPITSLAYVGSANFTRHGWGFLARPEDANLEAGILLRRVGKARERLRDLVPTTRGAPFPLGTSSPSPTEPDVATDDDATWPTFLLSARLVPVGGAAAHLALELQLFPPACKGSWSVGIDDGSEQLAAGTEGADSPTLILALSPPQLAAVLRSKEIRVHWWACQAGRAFPVNLSPEARLELPLGDVPLRPAERFLLAYYQGRIAFEDLFPPPQEEGPEAGETRDASSDSEVDTSRIQSYQMRDFVTALSGIEADLRSAAQGTEASVRMALKGPVSPLALARAAREAVRAGTRSATAGAFQLVEIAAAVQRAADAVAELPQAAAFEAHATSVHQELSQLLANLQATSPDELGQKAQFHRYMRAVQPRLGGVR